MADTDQVKTIIKLARSIRATPIPQLMTNPKWGAINFEAAQGDLEMIYGLAGHLETLPVKILPTSVANTYIDVLQRVLVTLAQIEKFDISEASSIPSQQRDAIVAQVRSISDELLQQTQGWIAFLAYQQGDVQRNIEQLTTVLVEAQALLTKANADAEKSKGDLDLIVAATRSASASAGVGVFTHDFADQANNLESDATFWLKVTAAAAGTTLTVALLSLLINLADTPGALAQYLTTKILILIVLLSATVWCGRIYKATKHQAATNRHRALALRTFQAFVQATKDESTQNAVLVEATRSIFAIAPSGYLDTTESSIEPASKILEIFKTSGKASPA